jgi:hypothetical protein
MAIFVPVTPVSVDAYSALYFWGGDGLMGLDDQGEAIECWAYPHISWQLTGNTDGLSVDILGCNEVISSGSTQLAGPTSTNCWGKLYTLDGSNWVSDRMSDTFVKGDDYTRCRYMRPVVVHSNTSVGTSARDVGLMLFATRPYSNRP